MPDASAKVRLFVESDLAAGAEVALTQPQAHYLFAVMRMGVGAAARLFNGRDGEWIAEVVEAGRRGGRLTCRERSRGQTRPRDLHLLFAPVKKARTDFIVEKACELGCAALRPVFTRFTNAERLRADRLRAHMVEAAEQCGFLSIPDLAEPVRLDRVLDGWGRGGDEGRRLVFCDERRDAPPLAEALAAHAPAPGGDAGPWAVLIGPEGGFSDDEALRLRRVPGVVPASLGPRVLRADTAATTALALWQSVLGDWSGGETEI
ncbi:16S rRNA (uracil1498-N3)-methyltransferase [Albimonas donghaensis]|uniref:Ribosomal RNA small subunit methyltransferase E n=1 Tax=Albimonas donghaensis TaxID=356660 RepID=A0A1H2VRH9_9RHOB|nr:16S rRNA (uracil(1498)-N(3))-methyltransferase [Albimonas donghaensis]SDW70878.1 16S rRNA (uracil1498-N3)-methyltransferase [Albimonas donghaensis]